MSIHPPRLPAATGWPDFPPGLVWLVGAGPGDPGLLTLHGLNALSQADLVVYDALMDASVLDWARPDAERVFAGKRGGRPSPTQACITERLIAEARAGRRVLRLKGGDPFVFGRGGEEAETLLRAGVSVRVTPGVSAGIGGLAYAGLPVTHRDVNQAVTFVTGHDAAGLVPGGLDWEALARGAPVLVFYMAMRHLGAIAERLIAGGRAPDEPVAVVADATRPEMARLETTLARAAEDVARSGIGAPAVICVGPVPRLGDLGPGLGALVAGRALGADQPAPA